MVQALVLKLAPLRGCLHQVISSDASTASLILSLWLVLVTVDIVCLGQPQHRRLHTVWPVVAALIVCSMLHRMPPKIFMASAWLGRCLQSIIALCLMLTAASSLHHSNEPSSSGQDASQTGAVTTFAVCQSQAFAQ